VSRAENDCMFDILLATHNLRHDGWGPGPWLLIPWLLLIAVLVWVWLRWRRQPSSRDGESVLAERYARGEIDDDEYRSRLTILRERRR
jgi:putative membrane protein